jgi:predicted AlkP superfamily pyrophosphatase or phosphodiesterase
MRKTTIVILIDALGFSLAERHGFRPADLPARARLRTVLGFSQAALATIFTGVMPDRHGLWMMYSFARDGSPFAWLRFVPRRVSARRLWLRRLIRWSLARVSGVRGYYSLYDVPRGVLPSLDIPAREDMFAPRGGGGAPSVFDRLEKDRAPRMVWDYRTEEARAFDELEEAVGEKTASFYLLYTAGLDSDLHRYGTMAPRIGERLAWYRDRIARVCAAARNAGGARIVVLGDHGMCDVTAHIDVMGSVEAIGFEMPGEYVPFYDSTMARFKIKSSRARAALEELLSDYPGGRILSPEETKGLGVAFPDGRFGDLIYLADPGVMILPSYMGSDRVAAMHGYHPDTEGMYSVLFSNDPLPAGEMSLCDVAGVMLSGFDPARGGDGS